MSQQQEAALLAAFQRMAESDRLMLLSLAKDCAFDATNRRPQLQIIVSKPTKQ